MKLSITKLNIQTKTKLISNPFANPIIPQAGMYVKLVNRPRAHWTPAMDKYSNQVVQILHIPDSRDVFYLADNSGWCFMRSDIFRPATPYEISQYLEQHNGSI